MESSAEPPVIIAGRDNGRPAGHPVANLTTVRYAGFWVRFVAELTDSTILSLVSYVIQALLVGVAYGVRKAQLGAEAPGYFSVFSPFVLQVMNLALYLVIAVPYYVWAHFCYGTTLGKRYGMTISTLGLMSRRIYVVSAGTLEPITLRQSWIRCLGYAVSYLPFGCGYLMAAFHPQKLALHDLLAGTVSVLRPEKPKAGR